jgi:signal transduction histidine kinase
MGKLVFDFPDQIDLAQFVSVEAHDLRSPFNHVVGFSKLMLNGQDGPLTDLQKEDLTTVYRSALRALTLMNNLIDMARLGRREKTVSPALLDTLRVLDEAVAQWKKVNPGRQIQVEIDGQPALPALQADEAHLKQAVVSFMGYAAEYVENPAKIIVRAEAEPGWHVITITSTGKRPPFVPALDLSMYGFIGRGMVELNGGLIRSGEDRADGATICFALPL